MKSPFDSPVFRLLVMLIAGLILLAGTHSTKAQTPIPVLSGRVVDKAQMLSAQMGDQLTHLLRQHEDSTGNQIAILTIESLNDETIEEFSIRVAEGWRLGQSGQDNGVLLTIARDDRKVRIEVGYGLEGVLPDALAGQIIRDEIVPAFREGDYEDGIWQGSLSIVLALSGAYEPRAFSSGGMDGGLENDWVFRLMFGGIFAGVASIFAFIGILSVGSIRWFLYLFLIPFFGIGIGFATMSFYGAIIGLIIYTILYWGLPRTPWIKQMKKKIGDGDGIVWTSGGGGSWSSSSSGSSWSSGGGSSFSGGGGSFGGGGASGGW